MGSAKRRFSRLATGLFGLFGGAGGIALPTFGLRKFLHAIRDNLLAIFGIGSTTVTMSPSGEPSSLFKQLFDLETLENAWRDVARNRGGPGVDGVTIRSLKRNNHAGVRPLLLQIQQDLRLRAYRPLPVKRKYIAKRSGGQRPIGIPTVRDRVVQAAMKQVTEKMFEDKFEACSYGFRRECSAHHAVLAVLDALKKFDTVIDADIHAFFDSIKHATVLDMFRGVVDDPDFVNIVEMWLRAGVIEMGNWSPTPHGTPQGGVYSTLLANIVLNKLDHELVRHPVRECQIVRYADDFVVLCASKDAGALYAQTKKILKRLGLQLSPKKTRPRVPVAAGFDFLGFTFHARRLNPNTVDVYYVPAKKRTTDFVSSLPNLLNDTHSGRRGGRRQHRQSASVCSKAGSTALDNCCWIGLERSIDGWAAYFRGPGTHPAKTYRIFCRIKQAALIAYKRHLRWNGRKLTPSEQIQVKHRLTEILKCLQVR